MAVIRTLCGRCGVGCGLRAITGEDRDLMVEGDRMHPANAGRLCGRGLEIAEEVGLEGRLLQPMIDGRPQRWEKAIAQVARRLSAVIAQHGPDSVALHVGGGLLTEDYYVANKLMKGFIGSAHVDAGWAANDGAALAQHWKPTLIIGVLNSAVGAYYYLRIVVLMYLSPAQEEVQVRGGWPLASTIATCAGRAAPCGSPWSSPRSPTGPPSSTCSDRCR